MTEFDLEWPNELERADWFEDTIRAFFGHPQLNGVILWRFWNETDKDQNQELVQGPDSSNIAVRSSALWASDLIISGSALWASDLIISGSALWASDLIIGSRVLWTV